MKPKIMMGAFNIDVIFSDEILDKIKHELQNIKILVNIGHVCTI